MHEYEYEVDLRLRELLTFQFYMLLFRMKLGFFFGLWILVGLYMITQVATGQVSLSEAKTGFLIVFGLPTFLVGTTIIGTYRSFNQVWKPRLPIRFSVGPEGVATSMPTMASQIEWSGIQETKSWGGLFLLFLNRHCALIIPTRCVGEQLDGLKDYVADRLRRGPRGNQ